MKWFGQPRPPNAVETPRVPRVISYHMLELTRDELLGLWLRYTFLATKNNLTEAERSILAKVNGLLAAAELSPRCSACNDRGLYPELCPDCGREAGL